MRRVLAWSLSTWFLLGCDDRYDVKEDLQHVQPDWEAPGWATIEEDALRDFYNVQRAIQWGNRRLTIRRVRASIERAGTGLDALSEARRQELDARVDELLERLDALEHLEDWRLEAEAINHAILALDREVLTLRT